METPPPARPLPPEAPLEQAPPAAPSVAPPRLVAAPEPGPLRAASPPPQAPAAPAPKAEPARKPRNPAKPVAFLVLLGLIGVSAWYVMSDRLAPYSSRGAVTALVSQIAPRVGGQVAEVFVRDNAHVAEGEPLFVLDKAQFELNVRIAENALDQASQTLDASTASLIAVEAKVAQAQANLDNARAAAGRTLSLAAQGFATRAQADQARTSIATAEAQLSAAQAELQSARTSAGRGRAPSETPQIRAARLQLEQARLNLQYATAVAPHDGVVTNVQLAAGRYVGAGSPAMTFIEANKPWIVADFRENQLVKIKPGDEVSLLFDAHPGHLLTGRVDSVAWGVDPGRPNSGVTGLAQNQPESRWFEPARRMPVRIEIDVAERGDWPANVRAGSKVSVVVFTEGRDNLTARIAARLHRAQSWLSYLY